MQPGNERLRGAAAGLKNRVSTKMGDIWWAFLIRGLIALALGVSALIWPKLTLGLLVRLVGIYALLDGAAGLVGGLRSRDMHAYLLPALVSLAVGAILLLWPGLTVKWLLIILGGFALLQGGSLFFTGRGAELDDPNRGVLITTGAVLALIGLVLIFWPGAGAVTISWLVAVLAFVIGALLTFLALRLRRIKQRVGSLGQVDR